MTQLNGDRASTAGTADMSSIIGTPEELLKISPKFTENILIDILKEISGHSEVKLGQYTLFRRDACGDSYLSTITRLAVQGSDVVSKKQYSIALIVKSLPHNIGRRKTFRSCEFFQNETAFYEKVMAKLLEFQKRKNPEKPFLEVPRCFKAVADGENDFIVMEDVSPTGFKSASRTESLDFEHCASVLRCLGRFHGLSLAMKDQEPEEFKKAASCLKETYYSEDQREWYRNMMKRICNITIDAMEQEYPNSSYEKKAKEFCNEGLFDVQMDLVKPREPYSVITNGDAWICNFLFLYKDADGKKIQDTRMIDFQLARYASPVCDMSFFLYSCTTKEFREAYLSDLVQIYYKSMSDLVSDLGSDPNAVFPYKALESEMKAVSRYGFIMSLESVPFSEIDEKDAPNIDLIEGDDAVPLEKIWVLPPMHKEARQRIANNVIYAIENDHIS
ncbi:uncharacterized protein LOC126191015 isoform X4 [Schistocerca cancellata]|uniref:uncharacterized protein LOC126191015 isoform X4 n=1 Tax=Schistocerca cancellata TaxID=274614 RepID=UPI002117CA26|nr:uncharacterized protein LOC126191015 isoform X4 [Schistocerca cancellata]